MRPALLALALLLGASAAGNGAERRCGWLFNPTPANWWLTDRDGQWILSEQGGYHAPGLDEMPDMARGGWVSTNVGSYGYGCACLEVILDRKHGKIARLIGAEQLPLSRCRSDRALPPEPR